MPELVRTSLMTLFPDSLSATIDFSSLSFAYSPTNPLLSKISHKATRSSGRRSPVHSPARSGGRTPRPTGTPCAG
uniref:Uncharacterized protein n=1 Tax=Oryza brachyantha TaxID=4533 RepID=J3N2L7_ORYBR